MADEWDKLDRQFTGTAAPAAGSRDPWDELDAAQGRSAPGTAAPAQAARATIAPVSQLPKVGEKQTFLDRLGQGMRDPIDGGVQLLTHALSPSAQKKMIDVNNWLSDKTGGMFAKLPEGGIDQQIAERETAYQAARRAAQPRDLSSIIADQQKDPGFDGWRFTGNIASPVNLAAAAKIPQAASLAGRMAIGAAYGGGTAALAPVTQGDFASEKAKQIAFGAIGGGVMPAVTGAVSRVLSPKAASNPQLQLLKDEGVRPTIGQTLGGNWNRAEEKLASLPIMGDMISSARGRAQNQFNGAAINRATSQVGQRVDKVGQDGVLEAGNKISSAYDDALSSLGPVQFDPQFSQQATQLQNMTRNLVPDMRNKFDKTYRDLVVGRMSPNGTMLPETFKKVDSELGLIGSQYGKSSAASEQEAGNAIKQLRTILQEQAARSDPAAAVKLKAADSAYANLVRVEGAAKSAKNNGGVFTPGQLNMAIQTADDSVRRRAVSRGTALMQDLGNAGQSILGNRVPNSGTADRGMLGLGALSTGFYDPMIPAGLLGGAALYTAPAQKLLVAAASARPKAAKAVAKALDKRAALALPFGVQVGLSLGKE